MLLQACMTLTCYRQEDVGLFPRHIPEPGAGPGSTARSSSEFASGRCVASGRGRAQPEETTWGLSSNIRHLPPNCLCLRGVSGWPPGHSATRGLM